MTLKAYNELDKKDDQSVALLLKQGNFSFASSAAKEEFVETLLNDLSSQCWSDSVKATVLTTLKNLGREPDGSDPLFTKKGISILVDCAGLENKLDTESSREALKCISNCIYLRDKVKPFLEECDIIGSCQNLLKSNAEQLSLDTQFLTCRILFFMTVNREDLVTRLIDLDVAQSIEKVLQCNVSVLEKSGLIQSDSPINAVTVTGEALKLLFNLMLVESRMGDSSVAEKFEACLVPIFHILYVVPAPEPLPLSPPHSHAVHALMQYPYEITSKMWKQQKEWTRTMYSTVEEGHEFITHVFIDFLDRSLRHLIPEGDPDNCSNAQVDAILSPLLLVIRNLADAEVSFRTIFASHMLPTKEDRKNPVHQGSSLSAYLIRLMTCTMMPQTRDAVCETLFVLCNENASTFTQQVGYGNAVGYLVNKGIAMEPQSEEGENINPITGQYIADEQKPRLEDMTDEEKEREAEKLFVLFERLKKTGIIDVENPVVKAMQEGKLQEINDDENSDSD